MASRPLPGEATYEPGPAPGREVSVRTLATSDEDGWERFVTQLDGGTFFHTLGWKRAIEACFPFRSKYLVARKGDEIQGILPLFAVKNPFIRGTLVSVPFGVYGGIVSRTEETSNGLSEAAIRTASEESSSYCELRQMDGPGAPRFDRKNGYATFLRDLPDDPEKCLGMLPRKARAAARQAIKRHGLETSFGGEQLEEFYRLFVMNKRHLGSPVLPLRFFKALLDEFGDRAEIMMVRYDQQPVAGVMTFYHKGCVMPYYSGALQEYEKLQINNYMYLRLMEHGARGGFSSFDFGRSRVDSGSYRFKRHQGFEPKELYYQYFLHKATELPDLTPSNPRFRIAEEVWKRLPAPIVRTLGPFLIRYFV